MNAPTTTVAGRACTWRARTCVTLVLGAALATAMTTLAVASSTTSPGQALPAAARAQLLPEARPATSARTTRRAAHGTRIPRSPVGKQLSWLLAEFNGGSATITAAELRAHFSTHFLTVLPANAVILYLRGADDLHGSAVVAGFVGQLSAHRAGALVETPGHARYVVQLRVAGSSHHRISSLSIDEQPAPAKG